MSERIVAAAIRIRVGDDLREKMWKGQRVYPDFLTVSAPPPARHGTLMHPIPNWTSGDNQGFLTSEGRYVDRIEALLIAKREGQLLENEPVREPFLYSENLW